MQHFNHGRLLGAPVPFLLFGARVLLTLTHVGRDIGQGACLEKSSYFLRRLCDGDEKIKYSTGKNELGQRVRVRLLLRVSLYIIHITAAAPARENQVSSFVDRLQGEGWPYCEFDESERGPPPRAQVTLPRLQSRARVCGSKRSSPK